MASNYTYGELPPRFIRLLQVSVSGSEVVYDLIHVDSDTPPYYSAPSYTWDGQSPTENLLCSGKTLKVTPNVLIVLSRLASIGQDGDHHVWIDGVYINESNDSEKSI
jgi:hypothetical protein